MFWLGVLALIGSAVVLASRPFEPTASGWPQASRLINGYHYFMTCKGSTAELALLGLAATGWVEIVVYPDRHTVPMTDVPGGWLQDLRQSGTIGAYARWAGPTIPASPELAALFAGLDGSWHVWRSTEEQAAAR